MNEQPKTENKEQKSFLDHWLETEFNEQYESQVKILQRLGLVNLLPDAEKMGIVGIDGKEYPVPSKEDIIREIKSNPEKYETKMRQGFTKIQLTPFAVPLEELAMALERVLLDHYKRGKLLATKEKPTDPDEPLELGPEGPLFKWNGWIEPNDTEGQRGADVTGKCVYHVTNFDKGNHGGQTKTEILKTQAGLPFAGWEVKLLGSSPNIPREGKGKTVGGRKQLETNKTSEDYLKLLRTDPKYKHEQGLTNEDWLTQLIVHLEQTNQVIDDWQGNAKCLLVGSFTYDRSILGKGYWSRLSHGACLNGETTGWRDYKDGLRTAVPVGQELKI